MALRGSIVPCIIEHRVSGTGWKMDKQTFLNTHAADLTEQQLAAVTCIEGATLLLAVPGSGKTTALVLRTGYMTQCAGIPARQMLTLTFSRMAAAEMRERYAEAFGTADMPHFSTIHSFCVQALRRYREVNMIEEQERDRLLRSLYYQNSTNADAFSENAIRQIDSLISYAKNRLLDEQGIRELANIDEDFPAVYSAYQNALGEMGKMDFDDQLVAAYRLLLDHPEALCELQQTYRYISVDEAQDTSYVQHRILYLLAQRYGNIFMVGDEDQSIYGFRAAYPDVLLEYERIYPNSKVLLLETNFRSTPTIVKAANTLIGHCRQRHKKTACAARQEGKAIRYTLLEDASAQYAYIVDELTKHAASGTTQAVLYRNNESTLPLIDALQRRGIPFSCRDTAAAAIGSSYMQQVLSLLEFALKPADYDLYARIYHRLGLYTSRETLQKVLRADTRRPCLDVLADVELIQNHNPRAATPISELQKRLHTLRDMRPDLAVGEACAILRSKKASEQAVTPKADMLKAVAQRCKTVNGFLERMRELARFSSTEKRGDITLSTIHSAKGLEFNRVMLIDAYEGILPARSDSPPQEREKELDEELRLFYVGITRARDALEVITAKRSFGEEVTPSRFIGYMSAPASPAKSKLHTVSPVNEFSAFGPGAHVLHARFGPGVVLNRDGEVAAISFSCGHKKIHLPTCCAGGTLRLE